MSRHFIAALVVGVGCLLAQPAAFAGPVDHLNKAITHTREAAAAGRVGDASQYRIHMNQAADHAQAAEREHPNGHTRAGIFNLKRSERYMQRGNRRMSARYANWALQHFDNAPPHGR